MPRGGRVLVMTDMRETVVSESKRTTVVIHRQTKAVLDSIKHPGQSYEGVIQDLIKFWKKGHGLEETAVPLNVERGQAR